jgi:hypothetical protein
MTQFGTRNRDLASLASNYLRIPAVGFHLNRQRYSSYEENLMGTVMVKCPDTGRDISTGIVADRDRFNSTPVFFARVYCPICRTQHEWFAKEAWVREAEPLRRRNLRLVRRQSISTAKSAGPSIPI